MLEEPDRDELVTGYRVIFTEIKILIKENDFKPLREMLE